MITYIVPVYNSECCLEDCVASLYLQDVAEVDFEVILVNDGSTDNSYTACQQLACIHDNIHLFTQKNQGQAVARNLGLEHARSKYVMFVDSDDCLPVHSIGRLLYQTETLHADIGLGRMEVFRKDGTSFISTDFDKFDKVVTGEYAMLHGFNTGSVCSRLFLRSFIEKHKLRFSAGIKHEDALFSMIAVSLSERLVSVDVCTYTYLWNDGSTDRSVTTESMQMSFVSNLEIAKKIRDFAASKELSLPLASHLRQKSNSIIVSSMLSLMKMGRQMELFREQLVQQAKSYGLFPIKGSSLSWRTTILGKVLNIIY